MHLLEAIDQLSEELDKAHYSGEPFLLVAERHYRPRFRVLSLLPVQYEPFRAWNTKNAFIFAPGAMAIRGLFTSQEKPEEDLYSVHMILESSRKVLYGDTATVAALNHIAESVGRMDIEFKDPTMPL